jgi:bifunctional non-homologous end joining protein LigD
MDPKTIGRERAQPVMGVANRAAGKATAATAAAAGGRRQRPSAGDAADVAGIRISNADRVVYPQRGLTKLDVARYYESIADFILPHLVDRPLTVVRCPQGLAGSCFFQKHVRETLPPPVRGVQVEESGNVGRYVAIDNLQGLITLVQFGALELHPWGSRVERLEQPDRLVFDLDPAPEVPWPAVVAAARRVREVLQELRFESFARTTGGKGLHVVVPLAARADWDLAKRFARRVAETLVARWPDDYIATASKARRRGKVYVDYLRNSRGATAVASYSTRASQGATVATPVAWDEVTPGLKPERFHVQSVPRRLASIEHDPWEGFARRRQSVSPASVERAERAARDATASARHR